MSEYVEHMGHSLEYITDIRVNIVPDPEPDLSWLDQTDEQMGEGFEAWAAEKKAEYAAGDAWLVGVTVEVKLDDGTAHESDGVWGVECGDIETMYELAVSELGELLLAMEFDTPAGRMFRGRMLPEVHSMSDLHVVVVKALADEFGFMAQIERQD
jgi:hypothetical protein